MGIRVRPLPAGNPCTCHPLGADAPERIYLFFDGLIQCPGKPTPPNGHTFTCFQDSVDPCLWWSDDSFTGFIAQIHFLCFIQDVTVALSYTGGNFMFSGLNNTPIVEYQRFDNIFTSCIAGQNAHSGFAIPFWFTGVMSIVEAMGLPMDGDGLFLETYYVSDSELVHRFANVSYGLNKKILMSY